MRAIKDKNRAPIQKCKKREARKKRKSTTDLERKGKRWKMACPVIVWCSSGNSSSLAYALSVLFRMEENDEMQKSVRFCPLQLKPIFIKQNIMFCP